VRFSRPRSTPLIIMMHADAARTGLQWCDKPTVHGQLVRWPVTAWLLPAVTATEPPHLCGSLGIHDGWLINDDAAAASQQNPWQNQRRRFANKQTIRTSQKMEILARTLSGDFTCGPRKRARSTIPSSFDDSIPTSMAFPRLSTRRFGVRNPARVWTDAVPRHSPLFGPGA
jgi:hypothetical protein